MIPRGRLELEMELAKVDSQMAQLQLQQRKNRKMMKLLVPS